MRLALLIVVFVAFTGWSTLVAVEHGLFGFLTLVAFASDWGLQVFLDLAIALTLFCAWLVKDAPAHGLPRVPYIVAILTIGSPGALAYLIHRELKIRKTTTATTPSASAGTP